MEQIRLETLIATGRAADHRRGGAGQNPSQDMFADMLGDQLKKRAAVERADAPIRRRTAEQQQAQAEPLSGRLKKPVILSHPKTLRGAAQEVEDTAQPNLARPAMLIEQADDSAPATGEAPIVDASSADATDTPPESADKEQSGDAAAPMACIIQPIEEEAPATDTDAALTAPEIAAPLPESDEAAPQPADVDPERPSAGAHDETTDDTANGAIADAAIDADVAAALLALETDGAAAATTPNTANPSPQPAQAQAATMAATTDAAVESMATEAEVPAIQAAATPSEPKPARPAAEPKPRAAANSHANPDTPKPAATPTAPAASTPPHLAASVPANGASEFTAGDGSGDQALGEGNGFGQGWALHLAQGAAGKRPDFVAQLKQHLQNLPAHEQVAIHVQRALREGTNRFSIQLSPSDLGRIQVKLEIDEEKRVTAAVSVERPSTLELLQRDARGLERALQDAGLKMDGGNLSFSLSQSSDQEWAQELERQGLGGSGAEASETASAGDNTATPAPAVLDTAAGVADLRV